MKINLEIVKNVEVALQAIDDTFGYIECEKLKAAVIAQKESLKELLKTAKAEVGEEIPETTLNSKMQKTMLKASVHMNAMFNREPSHIAKMLIEGYTMGLTSVQKDVNNLTADGVVVPDTAKELIKQYDKNIKALRAFL